MELYLDAMRNRMELMLNMTSICLSFWRSPFLKKKNFRFAEIFPRFLVWSGLFVMAISLISRTFATL